MKTQSDFVPSTNFALLLQGPPMTGKTSLAMQFPDPWFADADGKLSSAVRRAGNKPFFFDTVDVDDDGKPVPEKDRWLRLEKITKAACIDPRPKTLVADSLSKISTYLQDFLVEQPSSTTAKDKDGTLVVGGQKVMTMRLWGPFKTLLQRYISLLRASGKLVICISHEEIIRDDDSGTVLAYRPLIQGALKENIASLFTDVWRTEIKTQIVNGFAKQQYYVRTQPTNLMNLGSSFEVPTEYVFDWNDLAKRISR